mmetsp:Transcript_31664/g.80351  ORF Transcript_31664/g.80351 Transcript_31664/m.80351 type:complete len:515 (-) Transcript_31664:137-1681(-)
MCTTSRLSGPCWAALMLTMALGAAGRNKRKGADYYAILDVAESADVAAIKKAYKAKALEFHPDKCDLDKDVCQAKFIEVSSAYEVLNDPEKRKIYNREGEEGLKEGGGGGGQTGEQAKAMFRQFFGREPDGNVRIVNRGGQMMFMEEGEPGPKANIYDDTNVTELTGDVYKAYINERDEPWIVMFYKPNNDESVEVKGEYMQFATTFKEFLKVGAVNCREQRESCSGASITDFPALRWFPEDKNAPPEVFEGTINAKNLGKWASATMPDHSVIVEDRNQLRQWLDDAKGPAVLLFTDKSTAPPMWKALSREFKGRASLGVVPKCDKTGVFKTPLQREYDVRVPGVIRLDALEEIGKVAENFNFQMKKDVLHLWIMKTIAMRKQAGPQATFREWSKQRYEAGDCGPNDSQLCFLWFKAGADPKVEDATRQLAHKYRTDPMKMMWANVEMSPQLLEAFDLEGSDASDFFVAFRPKRGRFKVHVGDLTFPVLDSFVDSVLNSGSPFSSKLKTSHIEL